MIITSTQSRDSTRVSELEEFSIDGGRSWQKGPAHIVLDHGETLSIRSAAPQIMAKVFDDEPRPLQGA